MAEPAGTNTAPTAESGAAPETVPKTATDPVPDPPPSNPTTVVVPNPPSEEAPNVVPNPAPGNTTSVVVPNPPNVAPNPAPSNPAPSNAPNPFPSNPIPVVVPNTAPNNNAPSPIPNNTVPDPEEDDGFDPSQVYISQARKATRETKKDVHECATILANYAADTKELRYLIEDCLSYIFKEFEKQSERIKLRMFDKFVSGSLKGDKPDVGKKKKQLLESILALEKWRREEFEVDLNLFHQHVQVDPEAQQTVVDNVNLKRSLDDFLVKLRQVNRYIVDIVQYQSPQQMTTAMSSGALLQDYEDNDRLIVKMIEMNQKEKFTIVIIGLEKAGKSTFVNVLLGADGEIVPTNEKRCTQVLTIIMRSSKPGTSATVEFYSREQFEANIAQRSPDSMSEAEIRAECDKYIGSPPCAVNAGNEFAAEVRKFIADERLMYVVKKVTIYTDKIEASVPFEIIDAPGIDSPLSEHKKAVSEAIAKSDAFVLLMSGQRPSLTEPQVNILKSILSQHYDAMSNAFAGITWLDTMHTVEVYKSHLEKCKQELLRFNFPPQNIYPICSKLKLLKKTNPKSDELAQMTHKAKIFPDLAKGYDSLEKEFKHVVKNELPLKRLNQAIEFAQKKLFANVSSAIQLGRQFIPEHINEVAKLNDEVNSINAEQWGFIFATKRWAPTIERALRWKKETLIMHQHKLLKDLKLMFKLHFDEAMKQSNVLESVMHLSALMLGSADTAHGLVLDHHHVEGQQRARLVEKFIDVVQVVSAHLARDIYNKYIQEFVNLLTSICPEEPDIFQTTRRLEHCQLEIWALLKRVAVPLIHATVRWPHDHSTPRKTAAQELARVVPWVALQLCSKPNDTPQLTSLVANALGFDSTGGVNSLTVSLMADLFPGGV